MNPEKQEVILVDENDSQTGTMEKLEAHEKGLLHRAFSIFIFNGKGEMLLQRRTLNKYHSGGLWSNTCCSHPVPGEDIRSAAHRRLQEELGFDAPLERVFHFVYRTEFSNGLIEHEYDHVFAGIYNGEFTINQEEVMEAVHKSIRLIDYELKNTPEMYTAWFRLAFPKMQKWWNQGRH
jgi:isopentenyl-diphosphate Delta-isomerase